MYRQPGKFFRSSRVVQFLVRYSPKILRSMMLIFSEKSRSESEKRSASIVPRREETPGEPRKKSTTRTRGLGSVRSALIILCAVCEANESRSALSAAFRMDSRDWLLAFVARHVNVAAS